MKKLALITCLLTSCCLFSRTITSISSGSWNNKNTWSLNDKPQNGDTVFISVGDTISMTANNDSVAVIHLYGVMNWASSSRKTFASRLYTYNNTSLEGNVLGTFHCKNALIMGKTSIGKISLSVIDTLSIYDTFNISVSNGIKEFGQVNINTNGKFLNSGNESCSITKGINNNGIFSPGTKNYSFSAGAKLSGMDTIWLEEASFTDSLLVSTIVHYKGTKEWKLNGTLNFTLTGIGKLVSYKLNIDSDSLLLHSTLTIKEQIKGDKTIYLNTNSMLGLGMNEVKAQTKIVIGGINTTVSYERFGNQNLFKKLNSYQNLNIANTGEKILSQDISVQNKLHIRTNSFLRLDTFRINHPTSLSIQCDSGSTLKVGKTDFPRWISIFDDLSRTNIRLHDSSLINLNFAGSHSISSIPKYGSLEINDGVASRNNFLLSGNDTLFINGNLNLEQSSTFLNAQGNVIQIKGNWEGSGTIDLNGGKLLINGNANNHGGLISTNSCVEYTGNKDQKIKVATYDSLIINKGGGHAITSAGSGEIICNYVHIKQGVLELKSEKSTFKETLVDDTLYFSSRIQDKIFHDIIISSGAVWDNNWGEDIIIYGDIINNGLINNKNGKLSFGSLVSQNILGNGQFVAKKILINKNLSTLNINSNLIISDTLKLQSGNLNLIGGKLELSKKGYLEGESNTNTITGTDGVIEFSSNYTNALINENIGGLGIHISTTEALGPTVVTRSFQPAQTNEYNGIRRLIDISPTNDSGLNATLKFEYMDHELGGINESNLLLLKSSDNGLSYTNQSGSLDIINNQITHTGINSFSKWTAGIPSSDPLFVELINFDAKKNNQGTLLTWQTLLERNSNRFEILKNGKHLAFVASIGNSFAPVQYSHKDTITSIGKTIYSLLEYDNNGIITQHGNVIVDGTLSRIKIYVIGKEIIIEKKPYNNCSIGVFNVNGQLISRKTSIAPTEKFKICKPGVYLIKVNHDQTQLLKKISIN